MYIGPITAYYKVKYTALHVCFSFVISEHFLAVIPFVKISHFSSVYRATELMERVGEVTHNFITSKTRYSKSMTALYSRRATLNSDENKMNAIV